MLIRAGAEVVKHFYNIIFYTMQYKINTSDQNYRFAVNYDGRNYYNFPMSIDIKGNKKYILETGTSDHISTLIEGKHIFIVGENSGLNYISLTVINTETYDVQSSFLEGNDINDPECFSYDILEKTTEEQIKILCEYLPY